jgi:hypothetical protein
MASVRIENRAQLIYLLTEAAELEHGILCCYLFATMSMKESTEEGVTADQLTKMERWRRLIREVALQEMLHLACVCNLLTAVGGAPQLRRPNLPVSPRAYPPSFKLRLYPLSLNALDQFVSIEMPESLLPPKTTPDTPLAMTKLSDIFSSERFYESQGQLYGGIGDGLIYLSQKHGEEGLFIGPSTAQTADTYFDLPDLGPIRDLPSALKALKTIVEQGEGASVETLDSHYHKFKQIRDEYQAIVDNDEYFEPSRPVVPNPFTRRPTDLAVESEVNIIDDPLSVDVSNLFDGCYELMVQMLGRLFVHAEESEADLKQIADSTAQMMTDVLLPLGSALTAMPAGPSFPGQNAGPSFRLSRGASIPTHHDAAWIIFKERLTELSAYARFLQTEENAPAAALDQVDQALTRFAAGFSR